MKRCLKFPLFYLIAIIIRQTNVSSSTDNKKLNRTNEFMMHISTQIQFLQTVCRWITVFHISSNTTDRWHSMRAESDWNTFSFMWPVDKSRLIFLIIKLKFHLTSNRSYYYIKIYYLKWIVIKRNRLQPNYCLGKINCSGTVYCSKTNHIENFFI